MLALLAGPITTAVQQLPIYTKVGLESWVKRITTIIIPQRASSSVFRVIIRQLHALAQPMEVHVRLHDEKGLYSISYQTLEAKTDVAMRSARLIFDNRKKIEMMGFILAASRPPLDLITILEWLKTAGCADKMAWAGCE